MCFREKGEKLANCVAQLRIYWLHPFFASSWRLEYEHLAVSDSSHGSSWSRSAVAHLRWFAREGMSRHRLFKRGTKIVRVV